MLAGRLFLIVLLGSAVRWRNVARAVKIPLDLRFIEEPSDTQFAHTRSAILNCRVEDGPANITWKIARCDHVISSNITGVRYILPNGSLYFPAFTEDKFNLSVHRADYQCIAKTPNNKFGNFAIISKVAKLRAVIVQPYKIYATDSYVIRGNTAVIKIVIPEHARDYVRVVSWHNGVSVITLGGKYTLMPSGDLVITNVNDDAAKATYYCTAVNILTGEKYFSNPAKLFLKEQQPSPPRILNKAVNITVKEGDTSKLQCVAEGYPVPTVEEYTWKKDGVPIQMGERFSRFAGGSLRIDKTLFEDRGLYECTVKNSRGSATLHMYLTVLVPLKFVARPQRKVASSVPSGYVMECDVTGQPKPNITWLLNGKQFTGTSRIGIKSNRLVFSIIYGGDIGVYQCIADNGREVVQSSAVLITAEGNPSVTSSAQIIILNPGQGLNEWCRAYSLSEAEITWYLDDQQVYDGYGYSITSSRLDDAKQSTLKADTMDVRKSGKYKCVACNIGNCTSEVIHVYIEGTTNITSIPREFNATRGQSIQLPCIAKGYPVPTITWSKDGVSIPSHQRQLVSIDNTLHISKVQKEDAGRYKCTAVNSDNKRDEGYVVVSVFELPSPTLSPNAKVWHEGNGGSLTCSSFTGDPSAGAQILKWQKDGHDIFSTPGVIVIHNPTATISFLELKRLTAGDSGEYTCIASNRVGKTSVSADMVVYVPPKFISDSANHQQLSTQPVLKTFTTYLTCLASGIPPPRIDWFKSIGGKFDPVLLDKPRFQKTLNGTLVISNVSEHDAGEYLCRASNAVSDKEINRRVRLIVHAVPANIVTAPANTLAKVSDDVTITCMSVGNLPIDVAWFNGSRKMTKNSRVSITDIIETEHFRVNSTLVVKSLVLQDTKQYSCRVSNQFGSDTKTFQIVAQQKPFPPSKLDVKEATARSIFLTWAPGFDGNAPITEYTVEFKVSASRWQQSEKRIVKLSTGLLVDGLRPASNYDLRVYAENMRGKSEASHSTSHRTLEAAPSQPPELVNVTAISSKKIYVQWQPPPVSSRNGVIRGYFVIYEQRNKIYRGKNLTVKGGDKRSYVIDNLDPYKAYTIEIQAFTLAGVSPKRRAQEEVVTHEDVPSQPPHSVKITVLSSQSMEVMWSKPPSNEINGKLLGYRVYYYSAKNPDQVFNRTVTTPDERNVTLTELRKFTSYSIKVVAFTRVGEGVPSLPRRGKTLEDIPGPPSRVHAIPVFKQTIRVLWDPPTEPNGIIRTYLLYYSKTVNDPLLTNSNKVSELKIIGNITSNYLSKLESDTEYFFWVKASTSVGVGNASTVVRQTTRDKIPANIFHDNLPITLATLSTSAVLDCEAYGYPKPSVMWYSSGRELSDRTKYQQLTNGSLKIMNVREKDAGEYECTASNELGTKTVKRKLQMRTPPSPPTVINFNVLTDTPALNITWRAWDDGNSPVTMFLLEYKVNDRNWKRQFIVNNINYYVLHEIDFNEVYYFRISAINDVGEGKHSKVLKVTFKDGNIPIVTEEEVEETDPTAGQKGQFYHNPTFLGVLIGVGALIVVVIVCLLLVAFRGGHIGLEKLHNWRKYWKGKVFREQLQIQQAGDYDQRQSNPGQSEGSPSTNGNLADSSSSLEPIRSTHGSEISLSRSILRNHFAQETIFEEEYPPPPPPYHSGAPVQPPPHDESFSDTSSEGNFVQPVYHRPTLHDSDTAARARRFIEADDHSSYPSSYIAQRSLNGTPGIGILGFRGHADGGSELDTASISRAMESNIDLRYPAAASRLSRASKSRGQSQELALPVYSQSPASGISRARDSGLGPSRNDLGRTSLNSKRSSTQMTPVIRAVQTPQRRESESSKECSPYHTGYDRTRVSRDPHAYDSASSEYSSSRDELISALEFGKRHNLDKHYGIPTLETTSVSSNTTNSSDQDGICKFSASPRHLGDGCFAPTPVHAPPFNPRSRSRGNENYIYVLDPRRRGGDRGVVPITSKNSGSIV